jgi:hypothetical protein
VELIDVLIWLIVVVALSSAAVFTLARDRRRRLVANSDPAAGIGQGDSIAEVRAKAAAHHRVIEAVRIFNEILHQDRLIPILDERTRKDVDAYLADYYGHS